MVCLCDVQVKHLLPLVVSERDALRRHLEVDHSGRRGRVHGDGLRGGLLNRLVTRQRLQRHRTQVPHVTRCTGPQTRHQSGRLTRRTTSCFYFGGGF